MKKLHISLDIGKLKGKKITNILRMRNFIANFVRILGISKEFAGNRVNDLGNIPHCGVVPKLTDLEVMALSITAESFGFDSENYLFHRLHKECKQDLPNLISRRQFNARRKKLCRFTEEIRRDIPITLTEEKMYFALIPNLSGFAETSEPTAAQWVLTIWKHSRIGVTAHRRNLTISDINSMLSVEYEGWYILLTSHLQVSMIFIGSTMCNMNTAIV